MILSEIMLTSPPVSVKDAFEKDSYEIPDRTVMRLHHSHYTNLDLSQVNSNYSIFHHKNFIGCFSVDKIKMLTKGINIPVFKSMAEWPSCFSFYREK